MASLAGSLAELWRTGPAASNLERVALEIEARGIEAAHRRALVLDHVRLDRAGGRAWCCRCPWCDVARRDVAARAVARG